MGFFSKKQAFDYRHLRLCTPEQLYADGKYQVSYFEELMEGFFSFLGKERLFLPDGLKPAILTSAAKIFASMHNYNHPLDPYFNERGDLSLLAAMRINRIEGMFKEICFRFQLVHAIDMKRNLIAMFFVALLSNLTLLSGILPVYGNGGSVFGMIDEKVLDFLLDGDLGMLNEMNRVVMCQSLDRTKLNTDTLLGAFLTDVDNDIKETMQKRKPHVDPNKKSQRECADEYVAMIAAKRAAEKKAAAKKASPESKNATSKDAAVISIPKAEVATPAKMGDVYKVDSYGVVTSKVMTDLIDKVGKNIESGGINTTPFEVLVNPDVDKVYIQFSLAISVAEKHNISGAKNLAKAVDLYLEGTADILIEDVGKKKMYFVFKASIFSDAINKASLQRDQLKSDFDGIKKEVNPFVW